MSIQGAFLSSLTSLNAQQAQIGLISNNVANANTSGYSSQQLTPTTIIYGGQAQGVATTTVQRATNAALSSAANQATSAQAYSQQMSSALANYSTALTQATTSSSDSSSASADVLSSSMDGLQTALSTLSANPGDTTTQASVVNAAQAVADAFHGLDSAISSARETADSNIGTEVDSVNTDLNALADNEKAIEKAKSLGQSTATLEDKRDQLVTDISQYIPVKTLTTSNGSIALVTDKGTTLYDGQVHALSFTTTNNIPDTVGVTGDTSQGIIAGLSNVTVDGNPIQMSQNGSIAANLQLRDVTLPQFSQQLNELAANVMTAFQSSDSSVASGQTGLFTASGAAYVAGSTTVAGLASTIQLNAAVDPSQGGSVWRIQSGMQSTTQGQQSDTTQIQSFLSAMNSTSYSSYSGSSGVGGSSIVDASSEIAGMQQSAYATWSTRNDSRTSELSTAKTSLSNATGVNVDDQMQRLLLIQQTYSASAQVIQAASSMLQAINSMASAALG